MGSDLAFIDYVLMALLVVWPLSVGFFINLGERRGWDDSATLFYSVLWPFLLMALPVAIVIGAPLGVGYLLSLLFKKKEAPDAG